MDSISTEEKQRIKEITEFFDNKTQPIKVDTSSFWFWKSLDLFYQKGSNFYRLRAKYDQDSTDNSFTIESLYFTNLNDECKEYNETPYNPEFDVEFKQINWNTDHFGKTFESGFVELQNNTDEDITYIKFRVILMHGEYSWNAETFLNQTVESYKHIYKGDITRIEIPGMTDYYTGFKIKKDELLFNAELIEVKPKPESYWCTKIEELKEYALTNTEKK